MALPFDPTKKSKSVVLPKMNPGKRYNHYRIFDDPDQRGSAEQQSDQREKLTSMDIEQVAVENKQSTIGLQTDHKQTTVQSTIGLQTDHKQTTVQPIKNELVYKRDTEQSTVQSTISLQTDHKQTTKWHFSALTGHERNFIIFIFQNCKNSGSLVTSPISNSQLRDSLKIKTSSTVKTVIDRIIKKGLMLKNPGKTGRGGWMVFELKKSVFQDLLLGETDYKRSTISLQTGDIWSTKQTTEQTTNAPYSSSNLNIINTNTTALPENLKRFGISAVNLQNLVTSGKATQEVVDRSLAALSYDVEKGKTGNLANILFGVLSSGREYISQKYSGLLQAELDQELARIASFEENQKRVAEAKLKAKFHEHIQANPEFVDMVKGRHKSYTLSQDILEKMAFEEFKSTLNET